MMFTERSKNKFGESPNEILIRYLAKDNFSEWNEWRDNKKKGRISLKGAYLNGARLEGADLSQVDLKMADLKNVNLAGADLSEANLKGAKFISVLVDRRTFIWGCDFDEQTVFSGRGLSKARIEPL